MPGEVESPSSRIRPEGPYMPKDCHCPIWRLLAHVARLRIGDDTGPGELGPGSSVPSSASGARSAKTAIRAHLVAAAVVDRRQPHIDKRLGSLAWNCVQGSVSSR